MTSWKARVCALALCAASPTAARAVAESPVPFAGHGPTQANRVVWFDLMVTDVPRAEAFYGALFGWRFAAPRSGYAVIEADGAGIGGLFAVARAGQEGGASLYFPVSDLQAAWERAKDLGAHAVLEPMPIPDGHGRMALFRDFDGNAIGLIQAERN